MTGRHLSRQLVAGLALTTLTLVVVLTGFATSWEAEQAGNKIKLTAKSAMFTSTQIVGSSDSSSCIDKGKNYDVTVEQRYQVLCVVDEIRDANGNLLDRLTEAVGVLEVTRLLGQFAIRPLVKGEVAEGDRRELIQ